jgi:Rrf2 family transcriptional regulator, cysteine metabolism repressor
MLVSQKERYALRAVFELARRHGDGPVKIAEVAEAQDIPPRFLEGILNELKQAGFVASRRGQRGGYLLLADPAELSVAHVLGFLQGPVNVAEGTTVFLPIWERIERAITEIYESTTFAELVQEENRRADAYVPSYAI